MTPGVFLRVLALGFGLAGTGCGDECASVDRCPAVDQPASSPADLDLTFGPDRWFADIGAAEPGVFAWVERGALVIERDPGDPECTEDCRLALKRLTFTVGAYSVNTTDEDVTIEVEDATVSIEAPLTLATSDLPTTWYDIPAGTRVHSCGLVDGVRRASVRELREPVSIRYGLDHPTVEGTFPLALGLGEAVSCEEHELEVSVFMEADPPGDPGRTFNCLSEDGKYVNICVEIPF